MTANALVTTRIDANIKAEASLVLSAMGLTVSDAVRLLLTKVAKEKALPFDVWQPNAETIAAMKEDLSKAPTFSTISDLMVSLNADD
jgi:DNA-damage-inducible protein J